MPSSDAAIAPAEPPKPKLQTLLGISPIVVISSQPPAAPTATPRSQPAPRASEPAAAPAAVSAPASLSPIAPPPSSSPDASSVARGLTTPSKPYVPKDDPSTPAVVISEAALADAKRKADRARIAQTIPAQTRSAPSAVPVPFPMPVSAPAAALLDDTETRPRRRSAWPIALGGLVAIAAGVALVTLPGGSADKRALTTADSRAAASPAATTVDAAPATTTASAPPEPAAIAEPTPSAAAPVARAAPAAIKRRPAKKPSASPAVAQPRKSASSRSLSASEPTPTTSPRTGKGLIVRETPF